MARAVVPGIPHHITQRGNRREDIFFSDSDRRRFLGLLRDYSSKEGLEILAYCLMGNHVHIVGVPGAAGSLARTLKPVNMLYARHVNTVKGWCGRVWQERYFSCPMDARHCLMAVRYVECNPVRAGLVSEAEDYPWSSAAAHARHLSDSLLGDQHGWLESVGDWSDWLHAGEDEEMLGRLRASTRAGCPLGSAEFAERLERSLGRRLRPAAPGRPRGTRARTSSGNR